MDLNIQRAIQYYSQYPSPNALGVIKQMTEEIQTYEIDFLQAELEMMIGDFNEGAELMASLAEKHKLNADYDASISNYLEIVKIHHQVVSRPDATLNTSEIAFLLNIRDNDPCDLGPLAQTLLMAFAAYQELEVECIQERSLLVARKKDVTPSDWKLYPNPTSHGWVQLKLSKPTPQERQLHIYDVAARCVLTATLKKGQQELTLDVSSLNSGVYWVRTIDSDSKALKLIIE